LISFDFTLIEKVVRFSVYQPQPVFTGFLLTPCNSTNRQCY